MRCYKDVIFIVSQKKTRGTQTSERRCWDRWDSAHPWAHVQACHMSGSVLSLVSPRDDFKSLKYNWRNRSRNWHLLGYADYYVGGKLQIPWGTHRNIVGAQIGPSRVREGLLELSEATQWERYGNFIVRGNSTCKGTEVLVLLFPVGWKEVCLFMHKQKHRASR